MTQKRKLGLWVYDYIFMVWGAAQMLVHTKPPKHYLEYIQDERVPIVLIPGLMTKWSFMKYIGDKLSLLGHPVYVVPQLKYNFFTIPKSAGMLRKVINKIYPVRKPHIKHIRQHAKHVQKFLEDNNLKGVVMVAHSKGGLIGKYYLSKYNPTDKRVLGLVAVASPFSGSAMAHHFHINSFRELETGSKIVRYLEKHTEVNKDIVSIIPEFDNHIWAEKGSFLDGAENIQVPVKGHHRILFSKNVVDQVIKSVEKLSKRKLV